MTALVLLAALVSQAPQPKPAVPKPPEMVPERNWEPRPGQTAEVSVDGSLAGLSRTAFEVMSRAVIDGETEYLAQMVSQRKLVKLPIGTKVAILGRADRDDPAEPSRTYHSTEAYVSAVQRSALSRPKIEAIALEAKILDGPLANRTVFVDQTRLIHMVPRLTKVQARKAALRKRAIGQP